jgi:enoyl-CoA hydratase
MTNPFVRLSVSDQVATVTLDRPPVNALARECRQQIVSTFDALHDRDDVRAVILTGAGKVFCAGADIKERAAMSGEPGEDVALNRLVRDVFYSIMECPKPVIAAVNGPAMGAGFVLALCCDILLAAEDAAFAMPEVDRGLAGGVKFLERHFTPSKARMLLMTGQKVTAQELYRLGVIEKYVPLEDLMPAAEAIARTLAAKSPLALRIIKESYLIVENLSLKDGYRIEQDLTVRLSRSEDAKEAKRAFVEKRSPKFVGR